MTSPTIPGTAQQDLEGRSVRDVVEYSPEQVNEGWCRKVLRKILQSLELQYAMEMPHRAITPDTIVFHANGEPLLISDDIDTAPAPALQLAEDLTALARVIHYAITQELAPTGPLYGRAAGYSAELVAAVDACMDPDPALRPHSVDAVRGLLGSGAASTIAQVPSMPPNSSASAQAFAPGPVKRSIPDPVAGGDAPPVAGVEAHHAGTRRSRRWAIAAGGGAAVAFAVVAFATWRDAGPARHIVATRPQTGEPVPSDLPAPGAVSPDSMASQARAGQGASGASDDPAGDTPGKVPAAPAADPAGKLADSPASGASSGGTTRGGGGGDRLQGTRRVAPGPATARYQLLIKPWGVVYVDGVDQGASPPLKSLALTPGRHTVRITHPDYRDSVLEFESARTTSIGKIIVDFDQETQ